MGSKNSTSRGSGISTNIFNNTNECVYVVLKSEGSAENVTMNPREIKSIPFSKKGYQTLHVYESVADGVYYSDPSDTKSSRVGKNFVINRAADGEGVKIDESTQLFEQQDERMKIILVSN